MARFRKPFFRAPRGLWYVWHGGRQINLGADKDAAFAAWHELTSKALPVLSATEAIKLVAVVIDSFLDYVEQHRHPDTYRWYKDRLQLFLNAIPADLTLDQLKPFHVQKWIDAYPDLASGTKRNYCRSIQRAMAWAEEQGYVLRSPLAHFKKPRAGKKELVVTPQQYQSLLDRTADQEFKDLLTVTWETGCRPQESLRVEARHVDLAGERWVFPASESKNKRTPRIVYLTPKALEITKRLMEKHPEGMLFRNVDRKPWTTDATNCRFMRIKKQKGIKFSLYSLRHSFATHALMQGVDCITVSTLMGHADPSTLAKTYQHLSQNPAFLQQQLRKATA
ncbi:MAG TPA: site-specific integrase [Tepidisphaeraceae bacterium]|nr:site-specific integrase [Tepidisphaeraceae bacterium]